MQTLPDILQRDEFGGIRLTGHRIAISQFVWYYNQGYSAEMLLGQFPSLALSLIHKTIAYYLDNKQEVDVYLQLVQNKIDAHRASGDTLNTDELRARFSKLENSEAKQLRAG